MKKDKIYFQYILDCIDSECYGVECKTDKEKTQFFLDCFDKESNYLYNKQRTPNLQDRIKGHISGLPSYFNIDFSNYDILQRNLEWGNLTKESTPAQENKYIANWFNFFAFKILQLADKNKIDYSYLH